MTIRIPYLRADTLQVKMTRRPVMPFFVQPRDYSVIDGDTLRILAPKGVDDEWRKEAFSVRFRSIAAPEKPVIGMTDAILRSVGVEPHENNPGVIAKSTLKALLKGRCLLIEPRGADKHNRLLGDICASGSEGKSFDLTRAFSVERAMMDRNVVSRFSMDEDLPPVYPDALRRLRERLIAEGAASPSP